MLILSMLGPVDATQQPSRSWDRSTLSGQIGTKGLLDHWYVLAIELSDELTHRVCHLPTGWTAHLTDEG